MKRSFILIRIVASGIILYWLSRYIPIAGVGGALAGLNWPAISAACLLVIACEALRATRFRILGVVQGFSVPVLRLFRINLATRFYMLFLPGGSLASIATRFYKLQREDPRRAPALSAVLLDRLCATIGLCLVGSLFWVADTGPDRQYLGLINPLAAIAAISMTLLIITHRSYRLLETGVEATSNSFLKRAFEGWRSAVTLYAAMPRIEIIKVFALSIVPHLVELAAFVVLGSAIGISLDLATWGWIRPTVVLFTMLPLSFSGLGVREVSLIVLLAAYGVPAEQAVALAASLFGIGILMPAALGALSEVIDFLRQANRPYSKTR
jgi:uncharacterized membrane protein YbhN (UPF0104 family)